MKIKFTLLIAFLYITCSFGQSEKEIVLETVNKNSIQGHIYFLADDLLKGRETGTPENKIAASYLANTLRSYGVKPDPKTGTYYQEVTLLKIDPPKRITVSIDGKELKQKVALKSKLMKFTGDLVYLGYGLKDDYKGQNLNKKIVVVKGGGQDASDARGAFRLRGQKSDLAKAAGAIGIIELIKTDVDTWGFIDHNFNASRLEIAKNKEEYVKDKNQLPYLWVQDEYGTMALDLETGEHTVKWSMDNENKHEIKSQNVVGIVKGTDPKLKNEYIIYSAHYDHVGIGTPDETGDVIYNGARDNAVGTTTVLSMAQSLAKYPTKRSALFILFTGEEKGLLGSSYYVENPILPLNQMVYCFNSDNAGYNDTSLATIIGLSRTTAAKNIKDAVSEFGLTAIDDPAPEQGLFDRSDNVNFAAKGIPSPTFSLVFTAFNGDVTKYYHQPGDHADSLDYGYLEKFFRAYVLADRKIANDPVTPFWTSGDKYEEAGKKLYNK
ncbi:MAG: M28 family peptidase [Flavobacteriaceae bacterium]|nr:M28 family peptidase [Flavobacteriaceae bacterium]